MGKNKKKRKVRNSKKKRTISKKHNNPVVKTLVPDEEIEIFGRNEMPFPEYLYDLRRSRGLAVNNSQDDWIIRKLTRVMAIKIVDTYTRQLFASRSDRVLSI